MRAIHAHDWFDGEHLHRDRPVRVELRDGRIAAVIDDEAGRGRGLLVPGLVDAHCHLFLDGGERDCTRRKKWLARDRDALLAAARRHAAEHLACGTTLLCDAGDRHGINHEVRAIADRADDLPQIRSAGRAIRKRGRYGSFLAREVDGVDDIPAAVAACAAEGSQALKILLTGIIDFAAGKVKGRPQFDAHELKLLVACACEHRLQTFAHCSGAEGIDLSLDAGIDSVEHGFFMREDQLAGLAETGTCWVPTFAPVAFQHEEPRWAGWDAASVRGLAAILDHHAAMLRLALDRGVRVLAGSDAGSHGVPHGRGLLAELAWLARAGARPAEVWRAATSAPRRSWEWEGGYIAPEFPADLVCFDVRADDGFDGLAPIQVWRAGLPVAGQVPAPSR